MINYNNNLTAQLHFYTVDPDAHKMICKSPKHFMVYAVKSSLCFNYLYTLCFSL